VDGRLRDALEFFNLNWTLEILEALAQRPQRFNQLQRSVNAIHAAPFNTALRRLVDHGLVHRTTSDTGRHYALTDKGARVIPLLEAFVRGVRWWEEDQGGEDDGHDDRP
jgi:DNA-binding HxlR family transcriptional regulator